MSPGAARVHSGVDCGYAGVEEGGEGRVVGGNQGTTGEDHGRSEKKSGKASVSCFASRTGPAEQGALRTA